MSVVIAFLCLVASIIIAFVGGKLITKIKLPAILGWLIVGMIIGPHALGLLGNEVLEAEWFIVLVSIFECLFGIMIGTEIIFKDLKKAGSQIIVTTITESLGTFLVVSLVFAIVFYFSNIPLYLAFIFGAIALATAPAPSLSVVREFKTDGPVTKTLIPMAALDDLVGALVFFTTISLVSSHFSSGNVSIISMIILIFAPVVIGAIIGFISAKILEHIKSDLLYTITFVGLLVFSAVLGLFINTKTGSNIINFMLLGMAYSTVVANMITKEKIDMLLKYLNPLLGVAMITVILDLAAPLDYHLIFSAGLFTAIYIIARAIGKYSGAYFGASITHAPETVKKYLGFTLLPHSGVSLVFTGIASSILEGVDPSSATIIQGTIAAAAVINEVIAIYVAKKGFEWAGELYLGAKDETSRT